MRIHLILAEINTKYLTQAKLIPDIWKKIPDTIQGVPKNMKPIEYGLVMERKLEQCLEGQIVDDEGCNLTATQLLGLAPKWIPQKQVFYKTLEGHIDLYSDGCCVETKATSNWKDMRTYALAQVCAYAAMTKTNKICVALPLSGCIITHELKDWNSEGYLQFLMNCADLIMGKILLYSNVGYHIRKEDFLDSKFIPRPLQLFLAGNRDIKLNITTTEITKFLNKQHIYVHAPYTVLLSKNIDWNVKALRRYLEVCVKIESKGLVIHIGSDSLETLKEVIKNIDDLPTKETPLILETSCGEGKEILYDPEELLEFYLTLDQERYKICVDTCHVFCAGYSPLKVIDLFETASNGSVKLIHYNNSAMPFGSRRDKHATAGFITFKEMSDIKTLAEKKKIDLVQE